MSASVAQEFYKLREEWAIVDKQQSWRLAVWVADYPDVDIINKFLEVEQSPIGVFDDIFFRFDSEYQGNIIQFEEKLWHEFLSWFEPCPRPEMDMYTALLENGLLTEAFQPDKTLPANAESVWGELVRFRSCIKDIEPTTHFCLYFPMVAYSPHNISDWFENVIPAIPKQLRLVTIDFSENRRIKITLPQIPPQCVYLRPKLDMLNAVKNEMQKDCNTYNTVDAEARFTRQVIAVMESTANTVNNTTPKEVKKLLAITHEINTPSSIIGGLMIAGQAYYSIKEPEKSESYTDKAIAASAELMAQKDPAGYPLWKSCIMLKGALLLGKKKRKEALEVYELLANAALSEGDAYFVMEGRRLAGHLYYELGKTNLAFEYLLLALAAGAYLDLQLRRQSTFLHAAYLAIHLCGTVRSAHEEKELKAQVAEWLGEDWEELLQQEGVDHAIVKNKTSIF